MVAQQIIQLLMGRNLAEKVMVKTEEAVEFVTKQIKR